MTIEAALRVGVIALVAVVLRWLAARAITRGVAGMRRREIGSKRVDARASAVASVFSNLTTWTVVVIAVLLALGEVDVQLAPLLAGAGVAGVAIGFGAQSLVRDVLAGIFVLIEDQYGVGDTVDLGEATGEVESVGLRITTVRDIDGTLWYVRNGEIARVGNMSQDYAVARIEVPVALKADLHEAENVALEAAREAIKDEAIAAKVIGEPQMLGVQTMSSDQVTLRLTLKTKPNAQWSVQRRLRREILRAYDENGIELPYPQLRASAGAE